MYKSAELSRSGDYTAAGSIGSEPQSRYPSSSKSHSSAMTPSATMSNETDSYPPSPRDVDASSTVASSLYLDHSSASRRPRRKQDLRRFATQCAVVDDPDSDHHDQHGSSSVPIYQTATFKGACSAHSYKAVPAGWTGAAKPCLQWRREGVTAETPTDPPCWTSCRPSRSGL